VKVERRVAPQDAASQKSVSARRNSYEADSRSDPSQLWSPITEMDKVIILPEDIASQKGVSARRNSYEAEPRSDLSQLWSPL